MQPFAEVLQRVRFVPSELPGQQHAWYLGMPGIVDFSLCSVQCWVAQRIGHAAACSEPSPKMITSANTPRRNVVLNLMPVSLSLEYILTQCRFQGRS